MSWNYRIIKYKDDAGYGLVELYYDEKGEPNGAATATFTCDLEEGPEGVRKSLKMAFEDAMTKPVFEEPDSW